MKTNTPIIYVHDDGRAVLARFIVADEENGIHIRYNERDDRYSVCNAKEENIFLMTNDGLNLAFDRAANLRLQEAIENNETDLLPTEVAYIAQAVQSKAK